MSLQKKSKWFLALLVLGLIAAFGVYKYIMQPPKAIEDIEVDFTGSAIDFIENVRQEPVKWTNKVIVLNGAVTSKDGLGINLDGKVYCQFKESVNFSLLKRDQSIKIKGRFIGYDDLMDELKLDQCIIQK